MKAVRKPIFFLGKELSWHAYGVYLSQKRLINKLPEQRNMADFKRMMAPMIDNQNQVGNDQLGIYGMKALNCHSIVWSLLYVTIKTRADWCVTVTALGTNVDI